MYNWSLLEVIYINYNYLLDTIKTFWVNGNFVIFEEVIEYFNQIIKYIITWLKMGCAAAKPEKILSKQNSPCGLQKVIIPSATLM